MNYSEYLHHFLESPWTYIVALVLIIALIAIDIEREENPRINKEDKK